MGSKLLEILISLSQDDLKQIRLFIQSSITDDSFKSTLLLRLFDQGVKYKFIHDHPKLSKEVLSLNLFPDKEYHSGKKNQIDDLNTDLFKLVRKYLGFKYITQNDLDFHSEISLLQLYRQNGLDNRFWSSVEKLKTEQQKSKNKDTNYYKRQIILEEEIWHFQALNNRYEDDANLIAANQNLDIYYAIIKMDYLCALEFQKIGISKDVSSNTLNFDFIKQIVPDKKVGILEIYACIYRLLSQGISPVQVEMLENLINKHKEEISNDRLRDIAVYFRYFMIKQYQQNSVEDGAEKLFETFRQHYENGYFFIDSHILMASLRNLNTFALKLGLFDWSFNLLKKHPPSQICGTKYPEEAHKLNWGEYYFYTGQYDLASKSIEIKPFENPNMSILADILLTKIYYETNDVLLESRMLALDQKIRRTKLSAEIKDQYYNFLKKLDKIVKYGPIKNHPKLQKLVEEIKTIPNIIEREWLLDKALNGPKKT